jgi:hypothetical protein
MKGDRFSASGRVLALALVAAGLMVAGCGRNSDPRFVEYGDETSETRGKVNLDRVTFIEPRIKAGVFEGPLTAKQIEGVIGSLKAGAYTSVRVKATIVFDNQTITLYESPLYEKGKNPPSRSDLKTIRERLTAALELYESI